MKNPWFLAAVLFFSLCSVAICYLVVAAVEERQRHERPAVTTTDEWVFEKYFDYRGNGIYFLDGRAMVPMGKPFTHVCTLEDIAPVLSTWMDWHPDRRVLSVVAQGDGTFLIITEWPNRKR